MQELEMLGENFSREHKDEGKGNKDFVVFEEEDWFNMNEIVKLLRFA